MKKIITRTKSGDRNLRSSGLRTWKIIRDILVNETEEYILLKVYAY